ERLWRDVELLDCRAQGDHHGMSRIAVVAAVELLTPPAEQSKRLRAAAGLIGQVVSPAAIGIDIVKIAGEVPREQQRGDSEVLVVPASETAAIALGTSGTPSISVRLRTKSRQMTCEVRTH